VSPRPEEVREPSNAGIRRQVGYLHSAQAYNGMHGARKRPLDVAPFSLAEEHRTEVLAFLARRPTHTFGMTSFIRDNGLVSPFNRGRFYGCRDQQGKLEGVALIGHATLFETRSGAVIRAFAGLGQNCSDVALLLGEQKKVQAFWHHYSVRGQAARLLRRELLFEQRSPIEAREPVPALRLATLDDLDLIVPVHAQTVVEAGGVDPLEADPEGFRQRCSRRVEKRKTWVLIEQGDLVFKAEVLTQTAAVSYLEGVWVNPKERGRGYGLRCISQLSRSLLQRTSSICLLVDEKARAAQAFYRKAGYKSISCYDFIFLESRPLSQLSPR